MPSVSIRPVSVTIPAPITTPNIPTTGDCESSAGKTPAMARAICALLGAGNVLGCVAMGALGFLVCPYGFVRTVATTLSPGRN